MHRNRFLWFIFAVLVLLAAVIQFVPTESPASAVGAVRPGAVLPGAVLPGAAPPGAARTPSLATPRRGVRVG